MDLDGAGGYYRWTASDWSELLAEAEAAGWEPTGTGPPEGVLKADWSGGYQSNDGQRVYARDAKRLADALESVAAETYHDFIVFCRAGSFRLF